MNLAERLKAVRAREGVTQGQICELLGFSVSTWKKYEGDHYEMAYGALTKLLQHPRFTKYTLWLMTGAVAPDSGQISPL